MKLKTLILVLSLLITPALAQDAEPSRAETMGAPSEAHNQLMERAGVWRVRAKMFLPDGEVINEGIMQSEAQLDGRFLSSLFKSSFQGRAFLGRAIDAYDNETKQYISLWMDNTSTQIIELRGTSDDNGKTITYLGTTIDPDSGKPVEIKQVYRVQSSVQHTIEEFKKGEGDEDWVRSMQIISSR